MTTMLAMGVGEQLGMVLQLSPFGDTLVHTSQFAKSVVTEGEGVTIVMPVGGSVV